MTLPYVAIDRTPTPALENRGTDPAIRRRPSAFHSAEVMDLFPLYALLKIRYSLKLTLEQCSGKCR